LAAPDLRLRYTLSKTDADKLLKLPTAKPAAAATAGVPDAVSLPAVPPAEAKPAASK
jgi:hypothetical protein